MNLIDPLVFLFLKQKVNEAMVGLKKAEAGTDMIVRKEKKKKQKQLVVSKEDTEEEWGGITADM